MKSLFGHKDRGEYFTFMWIMLACVIGVFFCALAHGDGNVGFTYSEILGDRALGMTGTFNADISERIRFESEGQLQSGDVHNLSLDTNFVFDVATVDLKLLIANQAKGFTLDSLGREQTVGLAFTLPVESLNFDVGIGGKNSSPFGTPSAFDTLVAEGFSESDLEGLGLETLSPAAQGIPFKNGNTVNAFIQTGFTQGIFDIDVKGVIELLGEGSKMHQVNLNFKTSGKVYDVVVTTAIELGLASYQETIHYETALVTTAGFDF